jgi:hypothetical protein
MAEPGAVKNAKDNLKKTVSEMNTKWADAHKSEINLDARARLQNEINLINEAVPLTTDVPKISELQSKALAFTYTLHTIKGFDAVGAPIYSPGEETRSDETNDRIREEDKVAMDARLEKDKADMDAKIEAVNASVADLNKEVDTLKTARATADNAIEKTNQDLLDRAREIDKKFNTERAEFRSIINEKIEESNTETDRIIDENVNDLGARIDRTDENVNDLDAQMDRTDENVKYLNDQIDENTGQLNTRLTSTNTRVRMLFDLMRINDNNQKRAANMQKQELLTRFRTDLAVVNAAMLELNEESSAYLISIIYTIKNLKKLSDTRENEQDTFNKVIQTSIKNFDIKQKTDSAEITEIFNVLKTITRSIMSTNGQVSKMQESIELGDSVSVDQIQELTKRVDALNGYNVIQDSKISLTDYSLTTEISKLLDANHELTIKLDELRNTIAAELFKLNTLENYPQSGSADMIGDVSREEANQLDRLMAVGADNGIPDELIGLIRVTVKSVAQQYIVAEKQKRVNASVRNSELTAALPDTVPVGKIPANGNPRDMTINAVDHARREVAGPMPGTRYPIRPNTRRRPATVRNPATGTWVRNADGDGWTQNTTGSKSTGGAVVGGGILSLIAAENLTIVLLVICVLLILYVLYLLYKHVNEVNADGVSEFHRVPVYPPVRCPI